MRAPGFRLAVHSSRAAAEEVTRRHVRTSEGEPLASSQFAEVGDGRHAWEWPGGGRLIFLRENVTIEFSRVGANQDALGLALQIDQLIQTGRAIAPRGTFAQTPEIVSTGAPATIAKGARTTIRVDRPTLPSSPRPRLSP